MENQEHKRQKIYQWGYYLKIGFTNREGEYQTQEYGIIEGDTFASIGAVIVNCSVEHKYTDIKILELRVNSGTYSGFVPDVDNENSNDKN